MILTFFSKISKPNLWEFHLSYSDLKIDISTIFKKNWDTQFLVHAPELFEESLLMDLASTDDVIREKSINETQRVIDITRELNFYFPNTISPKIICNIGVIQWIKILVYQRKGKDMNYLLIVIIC